MTLQEIAARLDCRLEGDGAIEITGVAAIEDAGPGQLTFFTNPKYAAALRQTRASAVIAGDRTDGAPCAVLRTREPYVAFARAVALFADQWRPVPGIHRLAVVEDGAVVAADASIGPFVLPAERPYASASSIRRSASSRSPATTASCARHRGTYHE